MLKKLLFVFCFTLFFISCKEKVEVTPEIKVEEPYLGPKNKISAVSIDSISLEIISDTIIQSFYKKNQLKTFWVSDQLRTNLLNTLSDVEGEGLFKKHFDIDSIQKKETLIESLTDKELISYDVLLTENLLRYIQKVSKGSLDPKTMYDDYDLKADSFDFQTTLLKFQEEDFDKLIKDLSPQHNVYKRLLKALKLINELPNEEFSKIEVDGKIELNDTTDVVKALKERLIFWKDLKPQDSISPFFDEDTELAVKRFQMRHGLATDGVVGVGTLYALNITPEQRKQQIIANLERWRWYPKNLGDEYLIINIPDYTLYAVKKKDTTKTIRVIVGKSSRRTPVLSSTFSHLVFNPTWTIPPTIKKNDIVPAIKRDRGYLASKNMTVYDRQGNKVSAENWNEKEALSYRYVQSPGTYNSLGLVKFMFPNRFSVYLHDTNSRSFFDRATRDLSSGCVRVQNPFELAAYLLDDEKKWSLEEINQLVKTNNTKNAQMTKEVKVHLFYWTAWSENETLQFRDDMYNKDTPLYAALLDQF
ncbi:MAG: L,D-transpeptidase family protein [Flavobacteriaceae bacterium]|nr:L,D-transpeptidase family protein [Flavobacteriaceae bacterium]